MHCAASKSCHRHYEPATSESAAARTNAATQPSTEAALARDVVSGEQSEGRFEDSTSTNATRHKSHLQRSVYHSASASRRRYGELAASESAATRTNAAAQPIAEAALA